MLLSACFYNCNICCFSDIFARVYERYHLLRILIWMRTVGGRTPTLRIQISTLQFTESYCFANRAELYLAELTISS